MSEDRRVSYRGILGTGPARSTYVRLGPDAITTRRKDARKNVTVPISAAQARWLREVRELSGTGVDEGAVIRALIDLGMELDVDWPLVAGGKMLRRSVRDAVMVRR